MIILLFSMGMLKASNPDISRYRYRGSYYEIYDAYPTAKMAEEYAQDARSQTYPGPGQFRCKAIVVDLGKEAGRLRYGVFIAKGARK